ncbi:MAG: sodium-dependent transporter, partial [Deltaproteobacteria bacterium]|nr:sodium-dependent transporter [Deltaproteobacteria bacterium]
RLGFVLAAAGSAVGLGNLWKFPYITWENKGGAFVFVYLAAVLLLGLPIMMAEILIGRRAQLSAVPAFEKLGGKGWSAVGWLGVAAGAVILSYYMVIAGWSLRSFVQCVGWSVSGYVPPSDSDFGAFLASGWLQIGLTALFSVATAAIVYRGIGGGIEKATKVMMPVLCAILLYLVATALTMEGRDEALRMLFVPRFDLLPPEGVLLAVGQAFFSLSLGLGAMIAYGSYISKKESVLRSAVWVVVMDTAFALLAAVAMFTIIFSVPGLKERLSGSTVGMLFITLPDLFYTQMPGGTVLAPLFFVLVAFAALSSTISLGEVVTSLMIDRRGWSRPRATVVCSAAVFLASILAALSLGAVGPLSTLKFEGVPVLGRIFSNKEGVLGLLDHLAANWMLPLGGLGITLFVGWFLGKENLREELDARPGSVPFAVFLWIVRVIAPLAILALLIGVLSGRDFS